MAETPRELGDFKGSVTLMINFGLIGYVSRQYLRTVRWANVILQFVAGSFDI